MSSETSQWLNQNVLVGFTEKRGTAWHYRADSQGTEPNHYPGAIPVEDVRRRLFAWTAEESSIYAGTGPEQDINPYDMLTMSTQAELRAYVLNQLGIRPQPDRKGVHRSDNEHLMGVFTDGYAPHQHQEVLLDAVANILDDTLSIGSAGLLRKGAQAWVSVEVPENIITPEGVEFRPNLLACGSHDGSLSSTYKRVVTNVVCDNTMAAGLSESGQQIKVKHSKYSKLRLTEAREALNIIHTIADDFQAEVRALCATTVTDKAWAAFLDNLIPVTPETKGRSLTMAENKRDTLSRLWIRDPRVAPWKNTAWGVVQAVNTYEHHEGIVRGATRPERNMVRAVTGKVDELDSGTLSALKKVLATV